MDQHMKELTEYMEQIKIKKVWFGGYDKEDVHLKLAMFIAMFEKYAKEQKEKEQALIEQNEALIRERERIKEVYKAYCGELVKQYSDSLRSLSGEFSRILGDISDIQKEIKEETIFEGLDKLLEISEGEENEVES